MSTVQVPQRPAFNSLEPGLDNDLVPPISTLSVICMFLGMLSLLAALTVSIVPFAILVAVLCAVLTWKLSWDKTVGGLRLAQTGLCLAVVGSTWGVTATRSTEAYMYEQASIHATTFLETLSAGKKYEAFELTLDEATRQVTGTDINTHYDGLLQKQLPKRADSMMPEEMPSAETMKFSQAKEKLEEFLRSPSTSEIIAHGKDTNWVFVRGAGVKRMTSTLNLISVVMIDKLNPKKMYQIDLNRETGGYIQEKGKPPVAMWRIERSKVVKE